jgi:hypothetical protein
MAAPHVLRATLSKYGCQRCSGDDGTGDDGSYSSDTIFGTHADVLHFWLVDVGFLVDLALSIIRGLDPKSFFRLRD